MNGLCSLHFATGTREACPGDECPFWEDDACAFERVGFEFEGRPDVARWLLGIRRQLKGAYWSGKPARAGSAVQAFLPPGLRN